MICETTEQDRIRLITMNHEDTYNQLRVVALSEWDARNKVELLAEYFEEVVLDYPNLTVVQQEFMPDMRSWNTQDTFMELINEIREENDLEKDLLW